MARLGSVLGGILAELTRARVIADQLTKELVADYEADPVLSSLTVPRVTLSEANLTLRFAVEEIAEVEPPAVNPAEVAEEWQQRAASVVFRQVFDRLKLDRAERSSVTTTIIREAGILAGRASVADMREALRGNNANVLAATARPALEAWNKLPPVIRTKMGGKALFRRELSVALRTEFNAWMARRSSLESVRAALASKVSVAVTRGELPSDPEQIQEFQLTLRGEDLDLLLADAE